MKEWNVVIIILFDKLFQHNKQIDLNCRLNSS